MYGFYNLLVWFKVWLWLLLLKCCVKDENGLFDNIILLESIV